MTDKTIPLDAVRTALMCAKVKAAVRGHEINGKPHARVAAYTLFQPLTGCDCRQRHRHGYRPSQKLHFGPMYVGDLAPLVERTRLLHGLPEVKRTWGQGFKAMKACAREWVMR